MCSLRCVLGPEFRHGAKFQGPKFLSLCVSRLHVATSLTLRPRKLLCGVTFFVLIPSNEAVSGNVSHYFGEIKLSAPKNAVMKNEGEGGGFPGFPSPLLGLRPLPTAAGPLALLWSPLPGAGRGLGGTPKSPLPPPSSRGPHSGHLRTWGRGQDREGRSQSREGAGPKPGGGVARSARGRGL